MNLTDTYRMLEDIYNTESLISELMLVEEGRDFFDSYSFGYLACKPLRFVEDNFKPMSVYDDHAYKLYLERLKKYRAGYNERKRKRDIAYRERERKKALKHQEILKERKKRIERQEAYQKRRMEKEREKKIKRQEAYQKRKMEKERIRQEIELIKEIEEREKRRLPMIDFPEPPVIDEYNPYYCHLLNATRPRERKKETSRERERGNSFEKVRNKYDSVYGETGHEEQFLIAELGCVGLTDWDMTNLLQAVWPERDWLKAEGS